MADVVRTCANCGNTQTAGDFCEKCGTRMPAAPTTPAGAAAGAAAAYTAARPAGPPPSTPPPYGVQPQYAAQPQYGAQGPYGAQPPGGAPPYGYGQDRGGWGKLFDFSFQGFVTPSTLKVLYIINLALIGAWVLFEIIYVAMRGDKYSVIQFFISIFMAALWFFASRIVFELMATVMRLRDKG